MLLHDFPNGSVIRKLPANAGNSGSIPRWGDPLEKRMVTRSIILAWRILMNRGAWRAAVRGVTKS